MLAVELLDHCFFSAAVWPGSHFRLHCEGISTGINRAKSPDLFDVNSSKTIPNPRLHFGCCCAMPCGSRWRYPAMPVHAVRKVEPPRTWQKAVGPRESAPDDRLRDEVILRMASRGAAALSAS